MTNKEKDLLIEALDNLKREVYFGSYLTSHSSMNIEEKAYAEEKMKNIDALIKNINANKDNDPDNDVYKALEKHLQNVCISLKVKGY